MSVSGEFDGDLLLLQANETAEEDKDTTPKTFVAQAARNPERGES